MALKIKLVKSLDGREEKPDRYRSLPGPSQDRAMKPFSPTMPLQRARSLKISHLVEVTEA